MNLDIAVNQLRHMTGLHGIGKLDEHADQLIVAKFRPISAPNQLGQVTVLTILCQNVELVVGLPAIVKPKSLCSYDFMTLTTIISGSYSRI